MFLKRIQVPDFRVLKDVDISFEPDFTPSIFPLGSLNGGGKSTLLQLIFILLSCSSDPDKHIFIQNLLDGFEIEEGETQRSLATISLFDRDNNRDINILFFCHQNKVYIEEDQQAFNSVLKYSILSSEKNIDANIFELERRLKNTRKSYVKLQEIQSIQNLEVKSQTIEKEIDNIEYGSLGSFIRDFFEIGRRNIDTKTIVFEFKALEDELVKNYKYIEKQLHKEKNRKSEAQKKILRLTEYLRRENLFYLCNYKNNSSDIEYAVLCKSNNFNTQDIDISIFLKEISNKVFLAAPFTQVFLFLSKEKSKLLFKEGNSKAIYYSNLEETKRKLSNLFTYDLLSVDYIINFFKVARDKDFEQAIETGEYGNNYQSLLKELSTLLGQKKINLDTDLSGVNFKIERDGATKELYPEDLSHGELKRLSIYVWLKYKEIQDCIVLIDEIENTFHPDWQYQIISDLAEWGKSNQYILATHSYELCQALTPAHVKELEPKLITEN